MSTLGVSEQDIIIVGERVSNIETNSDDDSISSDEGTSNSDMEEIAINHPHLAPKKYVFDPKDDEKDDEDDDYQVGNDSEEDDEEEEEEEDASDIEEIDLPSNILVGTYEFGPHEQDDEEDDDDYCLDEEN